MKPAIDIEMPRLVISSEPVHASEISEHGRTGLTPTPDRAAQSSVGQRPVWAAPVRLGVAHISHRRTAMPVTPDLVKSMYERWGAAFAAEPEMPLDRWRA